MTLVEKDRPTGQENVLIHSSDIQQEDVLLGMGVQCTGHVGTVACKAIVESRLQMYVEGKKDEKTKLTLQVIALVEEAGGRFLKRDSNSDLWSKLSKTDSRVKIREAFRGCIRRVKNQLMPCALLKKIGLSEIFTKNSTYIEIVDHVAKSAEIRDYLCSRNDRTEKSSQKLRSIGVPRESSKKAAGSCVAAVAMSPAFPKEASNQRERNEDQASIDRHTPAVIAPDKDCNGNGTKQSYQYTNTAVIGSSSTNCEEEGVSHDFREMADDENNDTHLNLEAINDSPPILQQLQIEEGGVVIDDCDVDEAIKRAFIFAREVNDKLAVMFTTDSKCAMHESPTGLHLGACYDNKPKGAISPLTVSRSFDLPFYNHQVNQLMPLLHSAVNQVNV